MFNFGYQRERTDGGVIANDEIIKFNSEVVNYNPSISYNNGTFTLSGSGDYFVSWFVTIKTGLGIKGPDVQLITNTTPAIVYSSTNSIKTGQLSGTAVIRADNGLSFQLVNKTGQVIVLADNANISANLSIIQINSYSSSSGIELQLKNLQGKDLSGGKIVPFNTAFIKYNDLITNENGTINILTPGRYLVDWNIAAYGSADASSIKFNLVNIAGTKENIVGMSESPLTIQDPIYGTAILNIPQASSNAPYTLQLKNASTSSSGVLTPITLADISIQASIRIVQI